jgi:hypothetical protein
MGTSEEIRGRKSECDAVSIGGSNELGKLELEWTAPRWKFVGEDFTEANFGI